MGGALVRGVRTAVRAQVSQAPAEAWGGNPHLRQSKSAQFAGLVGLRTRTDKVVVKDVGGKRRRVKGRGDSSKPTDKQIAALQASKSGFAELSAAQIKRRYSRKQASAILRRFGKAGKTKAPAHGLSGQHNNKLLPMVWRTQHAPILKSVNLPRVAEGKIKAIIDRK